MADDILKRLKKHTIKGRKKINGRHRWCTTCKIIDEIERLRDEVAAFRELDKERLRTLRDGLDLMHQQDAEIEQLRIAGNALEQSLLMWQSKYSDLDIGYDAIDEWQKVRHG